MRQVDINALKVGTLLVMAMITDFIVKLSS